MQSSNPNDTTIKESIKLDHSLKKDASGEYADDFE
jgi:hypothetical protein